MRQAISGSLKILFVALLMLAAGACEKKSYPGAPEGYNYRTLQVTWKREGTTTGTQELYVETSGYENGALVFKRMAVRADIEKLHPAKPGERIRDKVWFFNVEGRHHTIVEPLNMVGISLVEIPPLMRMQRAAVWREIMGYVIRRKDLTQEKRGELQKKVYTISDDELRALGAEVKEAEFMGRKVKYFNIPVAAGRAELWMYGDIPLKFDLESKWLGKSVRTYLEATKLIINKRLPEELFKIPEGVRVVDRTKPIPEQ